MGNRAVIALGEEPTSIGIYLHWNGGPESVKAFLDATRTLMKSRGADDQYVPARLIQVIGNFFGGVTSLGIGQLKNLDCDNGDNGVYVVDPGTLEITARKHVPNGADATFHQVKYEATLAEVIEKNSEMFKEQQ